MHVNSDVSHVIRAYECPRILATITHNSGEEQILFMTDTLITTCTDTLVSFSSNYKFHTNMYSHLVTLRTCLIFKRIQFLIGLRLCYLNKYKQFLKKISSPKNLQTLKKNLLSQNPGLMAKWYIIKFELWYEVKVHKFRLCFLPLYGQT